MREGGINRVAYSDADIAAHAWRSSTSSRAGPKAPALRDLTEGEVPRVDLTSVHLPSGAVHPGQGIALLGPWA